MMAMKKQLKNIGGVWSATPTPFTSKMTIDMPSIKRLVDHHLLLGVQGLFLAGTCGEGPWMPDAQRRQFTREVAKQNKGRMLLAAQVTDNSAGRILANIEMAKEDGADIATIAPPYMVMRPTDDRIFEMYEEAVRKSPLPVCIYDRGVHAPTSISNKAIQKIYDLKKVIMIKDSSADDERMKIALKARKKRPELRLLDGDEFRCDHYMAAGYDGLLVGGGIFNGYMVKLISDAVKEGDLDKAAKIQARLCKIMFSVFGGKKLTTWLTGQKQLMVELGVFSTSKSYLNLPMTDSCMKAIKRVVEKDSDVIFSKKCPQKV